MCMCMCIHCLHILLSWVLGLGSWVLVLGLVIFMLSFHSIQALNSVLFYCFLLEGQTLIGGVSNLVGFILYWMSCYQIWALWDLVCPAYEISVRAVTFELKAVSIIEGVVPPLSPSSIIYYYHNIFSHHKGTCLATGRRPVYCMAWGGLGVLKSFSKVWSR